MADPLLKLHDKGADVIEAQGLLNRNGAILDPDGDFGKGTETAVREFQRRCRLPDSGTIDAATWQRLRSQPEPSPDIPTRAVAFIAREEVGGRGFYDAQCARPTWPGGASGVTIGVGYDRRTRGLWCRSSRSAGARRRSCSSALIGPVGETQLEPEKGPAACQAAPEGSRRGVLSVREPAVERRAIPPQIGPYPRSSCRCCRRRARTSARD